MLFEVGRRLRSITPVNEFYEFCVKRHTLTKILDKFIMESLTIPLATTPSDSVLAVDSSSLAVVDSTSSPAKADFCSA